MACGNTVLVGLVSIGRVTKKFLCGKSMLLSTWESFPLSIYPMVGFPLNCSTEW